MLNLFKITVKHYFHLIEIVNNITVIGAGYVGTTLAVLLAQNNKVVLLDIDKDKVNQINEWKPILADEDLEKFLTLKSLQLYATCSQKDAFQNKNFYINGKWVAPV